MRYQSLDGWRGIAALFVSLYHLSFFNHIYGWEFLRNSYLFVDFFFVLSGFVITHAYQNKITNWQNAITFISRRLGRLLPLHLFVLSLFVALELLKLTLVSTGSWQPDNPPFTKEYSVPSLISNLFLLQSMGLHDQLTWNYPSWSISVEFYTYILFAIITGLAHRFKALLNIQYIFLIVVSLLILYVNVKNLNYATYDFGIFRCVAGFFLGSLCYQYFQSKKGIEIPFATLAEVALIVGIYFFIVYAGDNKLSTFAPLLFTLTVFIYAFEQGAISKVLKIKAIQNIGKWSYSIYMLHALILLIIGRIFNVLEKVSKVNLSAEYIDNSNNSFDLFYYLSPFFMDFLTVIYLILLIFIASKTYQYVELSGSKLFKKWLKY